MVDVLLKIDLDRAYYRAGIDVETYPDYWKGIVNNTVRRVKYRRSLHKAVCPSNIEALVSSGAVSDDQAKTMRRLKGMYTGWNHALRDALRELLGKDYRNEVWKIETRLWSAWELKNFLVVRFDKLDTPGFVFWKTDLGFTSQEISDIIDPAVVFNPQYTVIRSGRLFNAI